MKSFILRLSTLLMAFIFTTAVFAWDVPFSSTLARTADGLELVNFFNWSIRTVTYLLFIALTLLAANRFSKEQYIEGLTTFIAAVVAGTAPYLAKSLI